MNIKKKQLSAAIAFALTLTIVVSLLTVLPITFGQSVQKAGVDSEVQAFPFTNGIGQLEYIQGVLNPRPIGYSQNPAASEGNIYYNLTFNIRRPDNTVENVTVNSDTRGEAYIWYNCTQLGLYRAVLYWNGDAQHSAAVPAGSAGNKGAAFWNVTAQQQPAIKKGDIDTYIATTPKKIGTGQTIYIVGWFTPPPFYRAIYYDVTFTITKPDGTTDTVVRDTDTPGTASFGYVCSQPGTWKVKMSYAGDAVHNPCESIVTTWIVEDGYVTPYLPQEPLPTGQWKFPISAEYYEWYQISGPWPQPTYNASNSNFNPYSTAPNSAHVLWKYQMNKAGIMGGELGYFDWAGSFTGIAAAQGRLYWTTAEAVVAGGGTSTATHPVLWCMDEFTGKLIYRRDLPGTGSGGTVNIQMAQKSKGDARIATQPVTAFNIWLTSGGIWQIDPWTGNCAYYSATLPGGTYHDDAIYMNNYPSTGNLTKWDVTTRAIEWTKPVDWILGGTTDLAGNSAYLFPSIFWNDVGYGASKITGGFGDPYYVLMTTWNLTSGEMMVRQKPIGYSSEGTGAYTIAAAPNHPNGMVFAHQMDRSVHGIDLVTGAEAWKSEPMEYPWGDFATYTGSYAYGPTGGGGNGLSLYESYDGNVYAIDMTTGATRWKFFTANTTETGPGVYAPFSQLVSADNKAYFGVGEHTPTQPLPRGGSLYCVDLNTGNLIWTIEGMGYGSAGIQSNAAGISSGILWYPNTYDGCLYAFGKGPSATTVTAPLTTVPANSPVLIQGTVTDQSPGAKDTPAIADADQGPWMQSLYMNKPAPFTATGVTVFLQAMLSDGSVIDITHVTSDVMGHYETFWTPPNADCTYKILATFEGSASYYASSAQTALGVAAAASGPSSVESAPDNTPMYILAAAVAIIIAIAIATVLILRKRP